MALVDIPGVGPVKLGRNPYPTEVRAKVRLMDFVNAANLPTPPTSFDYTPQSPKAGRNIYKNNQLGCCVISGGYHYLGVVSGGSGAEIVVTDQEIVHDYSKIGGYNGTSRTDNGCNEQDALDYWTRTGFTNGNKLRGWLKVGTQNLQQAIAICWLFEGLFNGSGMPDQWLNVQGDGFVWDSGRGNPNNGHCFNFFGHDSSGFVTATWAKYGRTTDRGFQHNINECYVLLDDLIVSKVNQKAPNAIDWSGLVTYWNSLGGQIENPPPPLPIDWLTL